MIEFSFHIEKKILYIDDNLLAIKTLLRLFKSTEFKVIGTTDPQEALEIIKKEKIPIVIADYIMPEIDGISLMQKIKKIDPDAIRILISGQAELQDVIKAINEVGVFRIILKPWHNDELISTVEQAFELYHTKILNKIYAERLMLKNKELENLNKNLEREVHRRTLLFLAGFLRALDLRDTETQWHSRRVALYTKRFAEKLGLPPDELIAIERGALLHDIGKIGVSDTILLKPGKLTKEEFEEIKKHTIYGYEIVKDMDFMGNAKLLILQHHERWDGKGYPYGLKGKEIYIGARIFAIIDTYDAMTSDRPYRKALTHEIAIEEIKRNKGTQFDPECVDLFLTIRKEELEELKETAKEEEKFLKMLG